MLATMAVPALAQTTVSRPTNGEAVTSPFTLNYERQHVLISAGISGRLLAR